jgi:hypothetical protein
MKTLNMAELVVQTLDSIQPKLFSMLLTAVLLPEIKTVSGGTERKAVLVALLKILCTVSLMQTTDYLPTWYVFFWIN